MGVPQKANSPIVVKSIPASCNQAFNVAPMSNRGNPEENPKMSTASILPLSMDFMNDFIILYLIPYTVNIFNCRQGIASNHSRGPVRLRFSLFFSRKTRKKREKLRLPPAPLVSTLATGLKILTLQIRSLFLGFSTFYIHLFHL